MTDSGRKREANRRTADMWGRRDVLRGGILTATFGLGGLAGTGSATADIGETGPVSVDDGAPTSKQSVTASPLLAEDGMESQGVSANLLEIEDPIQRFGVILTIIGGLTFCALFLTTKVTHNRSNNDSPMDGSEITNKSNTSDAGESAPDTPSAETAATGAAVTDESKLMSEDVDSTDEDIPLDSTVTASTNAEVTDDKETESTDEKSNSDGFIEAVPELTPGGGKLGIDGELVVYEAIHKGSAERVRVVTLAESVAASRYDEFKRAASQWSALSADENVVTVVESGSTPRPWIALEQSTEVRLSDRIAKLDLDDLVHIVGDACQAVQGASLYNVRHFALTPDRIHVDGDSDNWQTTVSLWCLDGFLDIDGPTPFTAPEQLSDSGTATGKPTDVYRLAAIVYTALCGEPPFDPSSSTLAADIEAGDYISLTDRDDVDTEALGSFSAVLDKALSSDPNDRYTSAHHLRTDLYGAL